MVERILQIIKYATNGNKAHFAEMLGWKGQYLQNILKGSIGITPISTILEKFPDINARWLILGQGDMLDNTTEKRKELIEISDTLQNLSERLQKI